MKILDADGKRLTFGGNTAARDIVQFVPFADYAATGPIALAEDVLREVRFFASLFFFFSS